MLDDLPEEFDLIVIGTGFPESCIAAAASRIGKTVLHIDPNEFYGGAWASFSLEGFNALLENDSNQEVRNGSYKWHVKHSADSSPQAEFASSDNNAGGQEWLQLELLEVSRRFNIDVCPKILYSHGQLVQLLITSNICRYAEFRAVDRVCTIYNDQLLNVPCSRSDVFNTKDLSIVEKRLLMKFLSTCMTYGSDKSSEDVALFHGKTFREYLQQHKVTDKIATCVMQAIAMCNDETSFEVGIRRTKRFLSSLGRYGNTPFLFPMYGCGEIPQCFCRLCAVFGGIYCLNRRIEDITIDNETNRANVVLTEKILHAKHVVCSHGNVPPSLHESDTGILGQGHLVNYISRGIFITSSPLGNEELNSGGGGVNLLRLMSDQHEALLIQLSHYSGTCPKGLYLMHMTTPALSDNPEEDLLPFMAQVFNDKPYAPKLLYSGFFTLAARERTADAPHIERTTPIFCTSAPFYELDYDLSIENAHEIFAKLYGAHAEFLPRAPDPEEIVIEGEDPRALNEIYLPEDLREQLRELEEAADRLEKMEIAGDNDSGDVEAADISADTGGDDAADADGSCD